jgi:DNA-directed RNA polymerase specialized sigma24 family protein
LPVRGLESELGAEQEHALMSSAIEQLPSPYRSMLRLHNAEVDARQIAAELGIAPSTVRWRLGVARQKLEQLIEDARVTRTPYRPPSGAA